jgi:hypothetical protein
MAYVQKNALADDEDDLYRRITHLTFLALTIEAFMNHCGLLRIPWWSFAERSMSTEAKIAAISHLAGLTFDEGDRPMQSIRALLRIRNEIAHGKTTSVIVKRGSKAESDVVTPRWRRQIDEANENFMHEDVIVFATSVYEALGLTKEFPLPFSVLRTGQ